VCQSMKSNPLELRPACRPAAGAALGTIPHYVAPAAAVPYTVRPSPAAMDGRRGGWRAHLQRDPLLYSELSNRNERRREDEEISRYLSLVQERDHSGADAMLCGGDDTRTATLRDTDEPDWGLRRIETFAIVGSEEWSSWVDGHGRNYHVRLTFADGSTATSDLALEVIGNDPCIVTKIPF
jgi:hypothetical protein